MRSLGKLSWLIDQTSLKTSNFPGTAIHEYPVTCDKVLSSPNLEGFLISLPSSLTTSTQSHRRDLRDWGSMHIPASQLLGS